MSITAGIAGAGLAGRLVAFELASRGWRVTLFEAGPRDGRASCAYTGAGMLAPYCELEHGDPLVSRLGIASLARWRDLIAQFARPVPLRTEGSLVVAHPADESDLQRLRRHVSEQDVGGEVMVEVDAAEIARLEPDLAGRFGHGLYFPREGQIENRLLLQALEETLRQRGADWHADTRVTEIRPGEIRIAERSYRFDWVFDCRGIGARDDLGRLRGVRGELLHVRGPEVRLNRPVRVMHPRYPIYVVPWDGGRFIVGATAIESEDEGPLTVRSALELLSAAYALHTGFAEAQILECSVSLRPAFPDHLPRVLCETGLVRINGLYRHGFLVGPAVVQMAVRFALDGRIDPADEPIVQATQPHAA